MKIDVLTLFPAMFAGPLDESIIMRARKKGLLDLKIHDLRDWTHDRHKTVDDRPFGGGPGMLLKPEPLFEAIESLKREKTRVILLSPSGRKFDQAIARELARAEDLLLADGALQDGDTVNVPKAQSVFVTGQVKFDGLDALTQAMRDDMDAARDILRKGG